MHTRRPSFRSLIIATTLAITTVLATVVSAFADGGGIPFPK
jgi:hypothetical protein